MTYRLFIYRDPPAQHETCETYDTLLEATHRCAALIPSRPHSVPTGLPFTCCLHPDGEIAQMSLDLPRGGGYADTAGRRQFFAQYFEPFGDLQGFLIQREDEARASERERMFERNPPALDSQGRRAFS